MGFTLEGRLVGPYVAELNRAWRETAPTLGGRSVKLDLRDVTYSDASGKQALRCIVEQSNAEVLTRSPWSEYLAAEITSK